MIFAIALGGALGTLARYFISLWMKTASVSFPFSTLAINVVGSFLIGLFVRSMSLPTSSTALRMALTVGFCGGFTTFSAFSVEIVSMYERGQPTRAMIYMLSSVVFGVIATFIGLAIGQRVAGPRI